MVGVRNDRFRHGSWFVWLCLLACSAAGCGRGVGSATGTVKYKDQPLPGGSVTFVDSDGAYHQSDIQSDGKYTVDNIPVGPAKVSVAYVDEQFNEHARAVAGQNRGMKKAALPKFDAKKLIVLPAHYSDPAQSGLSTEIAQGTTTFDISIP